MNDLDPTGTYCQANGHAGHGCPGEGPDHIELFRLGLGVSNVPGPSDAELIEEMQSDMELMADEYHGRYVD